MPGERGVFGRIFEDDVFDLDIARGSKTAQKIARFFVAGQLAGIADMEHGRERGVPLEGPAMPGKRSPR